jgi:hypothetical protein
MAKLDTLLNTIAVKRYVNLFLRESENHELNAVKEEIVSPFKQPGYHEFCLEVDIRSFSKCENEKQEAGVFLKIIKDLQSQSSALSNKKLKGGRSISLIMDQVNEKLEKPAVIIFHYFQNHFSEKEKDILRSVRKYISLTESRFLGILLLSNDRVDKWELFPESNLDGRYVEFFEY